VKVSRHSKAFGSVVFATAIACSACGSSTPTAPTVATLRQQFLGVVTRTNAALTRDTKRGNPVSTDAKYSQDFARAASGFRAIAFPASMRHDARALEAILGTMARDAEAVSLAAAKNQNIKSNVINMAQINLKLIEAEKTEKTDSDALRHDLGLPAETTTTTATTKPSGVLNPAKG